MHNRIIDNLGWKEPSVVIHQSKGPGMSQPLSIVKPPLVRSFDVAVSIIKEADPANSQGPVQICVFSLRKAFTNISSESLFLKFLSTTHFLILVRKGWNYQSQQKIPTQVSPFKTEQIPYCQAFLLMLKPPLCHCFVCKVTIEDFF